MTVFLDRFNRGCFTSLFMVAICVSLQGQNLVPNPGFEDYTSCPDDFSQIDKAFPWIQPTTGTSDFFHTCAGSGYCVPCVPHNVNGYQQPHSGNGYAGFFTYLNSNNREYIQTILQTPLVAGVTYWVSFYVSLADECQFATNNIGAYFSEIPIASDNSSYLSCCSPQVNASDVITSKTEWTLISGCFVASGNEQYITIGNFYSNENTLLTTFPEAQSTNGYYLIDDVSVIAEFTFGEDKTSCEGDSLMLDATTPSATYLWQDNSTSPTLTVTEEGTYWVEITSVCGTISDTINIFFDPFSIVELGNDTTLCEGEPFTLDASAPNATYLWQDNSTNPILNVTEQGTYWVEVFLYNCSVIDTIQIGFDPIPTIELGNDTTLCEGEAVTLDATTQSATYLWQDNSTNPTFNAALQGTYWVEVFLNNCSAIDTIQIVVDPIPTIELGTDTTICEGESFTLEAITQSAIYLWQDNSTNPTFYVTEQGTYWVEITNNCGFASDSIDVQFNPLPTVELGTDTILCEGESITLDVTIPNATYLWQDNSTGSTFNVTHQGTFWVELNVKNCSAMDTIQIDYNPVPTPELGSDIALCEGDTITLDVTTQNATYLWQDNSTNPTFQVAEHGNFWVEISNSCGIVSDSINVYYDAIPTVELGNDTTICEGEQFMVDVSTPNATYLWQDNSTDSTLIVSQGGDYWVVITNHCGSASDSFSVEGKDCEVILEIPNVFTPNNDGKNDSFSIISNNIISMNTVIYNRWGNKVFETNNLLIEWNGEDASDGTYFYTIQYTDVNGITKSQGGYVTLFK